MKQSERDAKLIAAVRLLLDRYTLGAVLDTLWDIHGGKIEDKIGTERRLATLPEDDHLY